MEEGEKRRRADAYIFRRAAWVWAVFCLSASVTVVAGWLYCGPQGLLLHLDHEALFVLMVACSTAMALFLPAAITGMQVGKVVWRRWRESVREKAE